MSHPAINRLKKATALLLAAMVLLLGWAGVSPELHAALHGSTAPDCEHPCGETDPAPTPTGDHFCAVHLLHGGAVWSITPRLPELLVVEISYPAESNQSAPKALCPLPGNRGPPIFGLA